MNNSSTLFLHRWYNLTFGECNNTTWSYKFSNSFIQTFPRNPTCLLNWKSKKLIIHKIKSPTIYKENIKSFENFFRMKTFFFPTLRQESGLYKKKRKSKSQKKTKSWKKRNPNRYYMSIDSSGSSWSKGKRISKKIRSPPNLSITQNVSSCNTQHS